MRCFINIFTSRIRPIYLVNVNALRRLWHRRSSLKNEINSYFTKWSKHSRKEKEEKKRILFLLLTQNENTTKSTRTRWEENTMKHLQIICTTFYLSFVQASDQKQPNKNENILTIQIDDETPWWLMDEQTPYKYLLASST